ncbi:MAG TPA: CBS domain-containing protein [Acidimicrobiales bacterium]|nr:CBS domain-containing protein [Acidimicrobiales bacterium]
MKLRDFMQSPVYACSPGTTLSTAAREMETHNVGSLVVTDDAERIVGIVTDRDVALAVGHGHLPDTTVEQVMSAQVVTIPDDATLDDASAEMDSHAVRRLPVVDGDGKAIGIVSLDDLYSYLTQETITLAGAVRAQGSAHD